MPRRGEDARGASESKRTPKERERIAQESTVRLSLASSFRPA